MSWVLWRETKPSSLHGIPDSEQQALYRVLQVVRDDPILQERVREPLVT